MQMKNLQVILERDLKQWVRKQIGPICYPDVIQFAPVYLKLDQVKL